MSTTDELSMAYDNENIFAKILRGEIPSHTLYEDDKTLAFMDVMPQSPGHCLVIPKEPSVNLTDISADSLGAVMETVRKIAPSVMQAVGAEGFLIQQFNGSSAGQTVFHIHVHIIPRWAGTPLKRHGGGMAPQEILSEQAGLIKKALAENGVV